MSAKHVTSDTFQKEVLDAQQPTLVDFYADWCGPCRAMGPLLDELAEDFDGRANVVKVNVDEAPEIAGRYGVQSIPTFVVVRDGQATDTLVGVQSKQNLATAIAG